MLRINDKKTEKENGAKMVAAEKRPSSAPKRLPVISEPHYRRPSLVSGSVAYKKLVRHMFDEQVVRFVQRGYRKKHHKEFKGKYEETLNKKDNEPVTLRPLKVPIGLEYCKIADQIKNGLRGKLNFNDKDFLRNVREALRLNMIDIDDCVAENFSHESIVEFRNELFPVVRQLPCDEKGNAEIFWSPAKISFSTPEMMKDLQKNIQKLEPRQKKYFYFNLSNKRTAAFLWDWLNHSQNTIKDFSPLLHFYLTHRCKVDLDPDVKNQFAEDLNNLKSAEKRETAIARLKFFIELNEPQLGPWLKLLDPSCSGINNKLDTAHRDKDRESSKSLIQVLLTFYTNMFVATLSPDFDPEDPHSPLISLLMPHPALLKVLLKSFFKHHASMPYYSIGQLSTRFIRDRQNFYERAIELADPDLRPVLLAEKESFLHTFTVSIHDIAHLEINSMNIFKPALRYIRHLFEKETKQNMSPIIWGLSDLAVAPEYFIELWEKASKNDATIAKQRLRTFFLFMHHLIDDFWTRPYQHNVLIAIIDMILHKHKWKDFLGDYPSTYATKVNFRVKGHNHKDINFEKAYKNVKSTVDANPRKSTPYYVLRNQQSVISQPPDNKLIEILDLLERHRLLSKILVWQKKNGLRFRIDVPNLFRDEIESLSPEQLYLQFKLALIYIVTKNNQLGQERDERVMALEKEADRYADISRLDEHNHTLLFYAMSFNRFEVAVFLLTQMELSQLSRLPRQEQDFIVQHYYHLIDACQQPEQQNDLSEKLNALNSIYATRVGKMVNNIFRVDCALLCFPNLISRSTGLVLCFSPGSTTVEKIKEIAESLMKLNIDVTIGKNSGGFPIINIVTSVNILLQKLNQVCQNELRSPGNFSMMAKQENPGRVESRPLESYCKHSSRNS